MTKTMTKEQALAKYLEISVKDIEATSYDENIFTAPGNEDYLVLTDSEADDKTKEYIKESLWSFNASFLAEQTGFPEEVFTALQPRCEGANEAILKLVERSEEGFDSLVEAAISADGRGHFLSQYDGEENEQDEYYIYRTN